MKVKRLKKASRVLNFFRYQYGFNLPYKILLDGTFCQTALQFKINLREQMPKYLGSPQTELFTTNCVLHELEELGSQLHGAHCVASQFTVAKCPHKPLRTAAECIKHLSRRSKINGHEKYFVGTQDDNLLIYLREIGGIPLMAIRRNTILLEKPSEESIKQAVKVDSEVEKVKQIKFSVLGELEQKKTRKRPKAPNPLSCKKKKVKLDSTSNVSNLNKEKRKRVRKRKT